MAVATLGQLKEQLSITADIGTMDDAMLGRKLAAAQGFVERQLGYRIASRFGGVDQEPVPDDLVEAVLQLAAWWYESRETAGDGAREVPFGVSDIIALHRDWSF